jgi:hypothetical protein
MIDFSAPTDTFYTLFGQAATHYAGPADAGTECTVLFDRQGQESTDYGIAETARIRVRASEVADPGRGQQLEIAGRTWRVEYILGADEGTNELETALACIDATHLGL